MALPPGAVGAAAGRACRARAQITVLDRELGLVAVRLPKRGVAASLRRLRAAPGVRYVERDAPVALASEGCGGVGADDAQGRSRLARRDPPDAGARPPA